MHVQYQAQIYSSQIAVVNAPVFKAILFGNDRFYAYNICLND